MSPISDLSQLKLSSVTIELRYDNAYLLWDRSGSIWAELAEKWPKLKSVEASPAITRFLLDDRFRLGLLIDKCHVIDAKPTSALDDFIDIAEPFTICVIKNLNISKFTRLGFRLVYVKDFEDKTSAAEYLMETKMIVTPQGKHFNIQGKVFNPIYSLVWEGESTALKVALQARSQKIDLDPEPEVATDVPTLHMEKHQFVYDMDYYTVQPISKGQLNVREWISQAYHLIKRDSKVFLGR